MNKKLHAMLIITCTSRGDPLSLLPLLKHTTQCLTVLISTVCSPQTFNKHQRMPVAAIFSAWRNSVTHLCFICTSMSDTILSYCLSAAICHTATKRRGILVERFNLYCHATTTNIAQKNNIGGITFGAAL